MVSLNDFREYHHNLNQGLPSVELEERSVLVTPNGRELVEMCRPDEALVTVTRKDQLGEEFREIVTEENGPNPIVRVARYGNNKENWTYSSALPLQLNPYPGWLHQRRI